MPHRITVNVSLTPEFERFVQAEVDSGRYRSASEVFREGLRLLPERQERRQTALDEVRKKVREGLDARKRGELFDGQEVLREILGENRKRRGTSRKDRRAAADRGSGCGTRCRCRYGDGSRFGCQPLATPSMRPGAGD
jgi:antitoxin ParD1/3/4